MPYTWRMVTRRIWNLILKPTAQYFCFVKILLLCFKNHHTSCDAINALNYTRFHGVILKCRNRDYFPCEHLTLRLFFFFVFSGTSIVFNCAYTVIRTQMFRTNDIIIVFQHYIFFNEHFIFKNVRKCNMWPRPRLTELFANT